MLIANCWFIVWDASQGGCASGAFVLPMALASLGGIRVDVEGAAAVLAAPSLSHTRKEKMEWNGMEWTGPMYIFL